ncbi:MAG: choice-of-anchor D domain-containing protein [Myxococcota bacterium]
MRTPACPAISVVLLASLAGVGCDGGGYITYEREPTKRVLGDACVLNDDCDTGRCVGGVCDDGSCDGEDDCQDDELCVFGQCEPADDFACTPEQRPLLMVSPLQVDFAEVALGNTAEATVTLENRGDCLLTIYGVSLGSNQSPGFDCAPCSADQYPQRLPPRRSLDVQVTYSPPAPGEAFGALLVKSDDETAGDEGLVEVSLHATYSGVPVLIVDPLVLPFGHVPQNSSDTRSVRIMNQGSGNAVLTLTGIYLGGGDRDSFQIDDEFELVSPADPLLLPPYDPSDPSTVVEVEVTLDPSRLANLEATLNVKAHAGDPTAAVTASVELSGSSLGPPQIEVTPSNELVYKEDNGQAYPVGSVAYRQVTIKNTGQSDLSVDMSLSDASGDFSLSPAFVPPIAAGGAVVVSVFYNPSSPSDAASPNNPQTPLNAFLNITSNDTTPASDVLKTIARRGFARGGTYDDVLKLEMTFENADNSWAGNDFRDVNLELVSPLGFSCTKPITQCVPNTGGSGCTLQIAPNGDLCEQWNSYDNDNDGRPEQGSTSWIALGQYEEPERILLFGLGQDLANGQTFSVRAHYIEDCANIPTGILGDLLGIGGSILLGALGGSIGVPIAVDPGTIAEFVTENCWDRASSQVTVRAYVNGEEVAAPQYRLREKGECAELLELKRENGQFTVTSSEGGPCL